MKSNTMNEYPQTSLWNEKVGNKIVFINESDFKQSELIKKLGLDKCSLLPSFGIADKEEIEKRQRMLKFIFTNPKVANLLRGNHQTHIPFDGQDFLNHFDPSKEHNSFWRLVNKFIKEVSSATHVPKEILDIVLYLKETKKEMEAEEKEMAKEVAVEIQKATKLEGMIDIQVFDRRGEKDLRICKQKTYGYKKFSFSLADKWQELNRPKLTPEWLYNIYEAIFCKLRDNIFFSPLIVSTTPREAENIVFDFVNNILEKISIPKPTYNSNVVFSFGYKYDEYGFQIILLNVISEDKDDINSSYSKDFGSETFPGYSKRELKRIRDNSVEMVRQKNKILRDVYSYGVLGILKKEGFCLEKYQSVDSKIMDKSYKWFAVSRLCMDDPRFKEVYKKASEYRDLFASDLVILQKITILADILQGKSKRWGLKLEFPTILEDDHHLVSFKKLFPIHLLSTEEETAKKETTKEDSKKGLTLIKNLVPITSLPSMNGQMICFTGQNDGGKSATMEAIIATIYLAQSGLPVFGDDVSLNVKKIVGMVFLEGGSSSSSVCRLLLEKHMALLKSLEQCKENGIILFLDEVGSNTQERGGLEGGGLGFGKKLLNKLSGAGCSVVFSTQITELAEYAQEKLNSKCYQFNLQHQIKPGIGLGGIEHLMKDTGIDKLL